jgi:hypothetical protein
MVSKKATPPASQNECGSSRWFTMPGGVRARHHRDPAQCQQQAH